MTLLRKGKSGVVISVAWQHDRIWNQVEEGRLGVPVEEDWDCINWGRKTQPMAGFLYCVNKGN